MTLDLTWKELMDGARCGSPKIVADAAKTISGATPLSVHQVLAKALARENISFKQRATIVSSLAQCSP